MNNNTFEDIAKNWQNAALDNWNAMTSNVTNSESWFNAMNAQMDVYLASVKRIRQSVATSLDVLDLPKREDLARLSAQVLSAETRVAECEDRLDRLEAALKAANARAAAAEERAERAEKAADKAERPKAVAAEQKVVKTTAKVAKSARKTK